MKNIVRAMVCLLISMSLLYGESRPRPYLGLRVQPLPEASAAPLQLDAQRALLVSDVVVNGPADKAGLDKDTIIVAFNSQDCAGYDDFVAKIQQGEAGSEVTLEVIQNGQRKTVTAILAAAPENAAMVVWKYAGTAAAEKPEYKILRKWPGQDQWQNVPYSGQDPFKSMPDFEDYLRRFFHSKPGGPSAPHVLPAPNTPLEVPDRQNDMEVSIQDQLRDWNERLDKLEKQQEEILKLLKKQLSDSNDKTQKP